ncbi:MAG: hypothetical protein M3Y58_07870 [Chloroflexota bacterium]|nr:hypothetical protein [Chloroflexota bacterium]
MNATTDPAPPGIQTVPAPTPLYPAPPMVPVDFTRLDPLPPPPTKQNTALIRAGTMIATLGSVILVVSLFLVPWFVVRDIAIVPPGSRQASSGGSSTNQTSVNSFAPRIAQRDLHDFGIVAWASSRREKRDIAIVALALLTQAATLVSSASYRWRLLLLLAGCSALAVLILTLIDYRTVASLIRARITVGSSFASNVSLGSNVLKITGERPGTGMIVLLVGTSCVLVGSGIALFGGRRGKVLVPVQQ